MMNYKMLKSLFNETLFDIIKYGTFKDVREFLKEVKSNFKTKSFNGKDAFRFCLQYYILIIFRVLEGILKKHKEFALLASFCNTLKKERLNYNDVILSVNSCIKTLGVTLSDADNIKVFSLLNKYLSIYHVTLNIAIINSLSCFKETESYISLVVDNAINNYGTVDYKPHVPIEKRLQFNL